MTREIYAHREDDNLQTVMEGLAAYRFGAVLIKTAAGRPAGVVSKTDLILAYKHRLSVDTRAQHVMAAPVQVCDGKALVGAPEL
jgi:CBS domain-containing protein